MNERIDGRERQKEQCTNKRSIMQRRVLCFLDRSTKIFFVHIFHENVFSRHLILAFYSVSIGDCQFIEGWFSSSASRSISLGMQYKP